MEPILQFLQEQLERWPMARRNFDALTSVEMRSVTGPGGMTFRIQHNPARAVSTGAKVDAATLSKRPCFLCLKNRPEEQMVWPLGVAEDGLMACYHLLVNPFPIFSRHFTVALADHAPQLISGDACAKARDMVLLAQRFPGMAVFYNGPHCGASAPDHFHFQMVDASDMPLLERVARGDTLPFEVISDELASDKMPQWLAGVLAALASRPENHGEAEPRVNILATATGSGLVRMAVIPRRAHRPDFYGTDEGEWLVSPASVDLAGTVILPREADFRAFSPDTLRALLAQTTYLL